METDLAISEALKNIHSKKFAAYCKLLEGNSCGEAFWDVVVLTACDEQQAESYEAQLRSKLRQRDIPRAGVTYRVIADPPGVKVGNGGATFNVLKVLQSKYGDRLRNFRVLLIHAGGYSQRLPNHSICGKIFAPLPVLLPTGSLCTMLEARFINLMGVPECMCPGLFIACSDDIVLFDTAQCDLSAPGFSALAIRSSLDVAVSHGVFVLPEQARVACSVGLNRSEPIICKALQFLHKPSVERMISRQAICEGDTHAFTDSWFMFDYDVAMKLLQFYNQLSAVDCEVDSYGDFLQPLGVQAQDDYIQNMANTVAGAGGSPLVRMRRALWDLLHDTPLNAIPLFPAKFYHLGTVPEYIDHFCHDTVFKSELGLKTLLISRPPGEQGPYDDNGEEDQEEEDEDFSWIEASLGKEVEGGEEDEEDSSDEEEETGGEKEVGDKGDEDEEKKKSSSSTVVVEEEVRSQTKKDETSTGLKEMETKVKGILLLEEGGGEVEGKGAIHTEKREEQQEEVHETPLVVRGEAAPFAMKGKDDEVEIIEEAKEEARGAEEENDSDTEEEEKEEEGQDRYQVLEEEEEEEDEGGMRPLNTDAYLSNISSEACVMCSFITDSARVAKSSVVEYSWLDADVEIGPRCIVSGVHLSAYTSIPHSCFIQTLCLKAPEEQFLPLRSSDVTNSVVRGFRIDVALGGIFGVAGPDRQQDSKNSINSDKKESSVQPMTMGPDVYVTHIFGTHDDVKCTYLKSLTWCGVPMEAALRHVGLDLYDVWEDNDVKSLWNARLFPVATTEFKSTRLALDLLSDVRQQSGGPLKDSLKWKRQRRVSMADCLKLKDIQRLLESRERLAHCEPVERLDDS